MVGTADRAFARWPTHAMRLHEWAPKVKGEFSCMGHPPAAKLVHPVWGGLVGCGSRPSGAKAPCILRLYGTAEAVPLTRFLRLCYVVRGLSISVLNRSVKFRCRGSVGGGRACCLPRRRLKRSLTGSQWRWRGSFMAMWWRRQVEQARWPSSTGEVGGLRVWMHSIQLAC